MKYEFDPNNKIIRLCFESMEQSEDTALKMLKNAWEQSENNFERFIASYYIAKSNKITENKLKWLEKSCDYCLRIDELVVKSSLPSLYLNMAKCYEELSQETKAKEYYNLFETSKNVILDKGPFYHGTRADLKIGDVLVAGRNSNYQPDIVMNHIYFTAQLSGAGFAADLALGQNQSRIYIVEPTGEFENDPNVTDMKFPGNPTRSYRSTEPLKIVGEIKDWERLSDEQIKKWKEKLTNKKGEIIN